jgi:hypothetical protein
VYKGHCCRGYLRGEGGEMERAKKIKVCYLYMYGGTMNKHTKYCCEKGGKKKEIKGI